MVSKIKNKSGEYITHLPNSERLQENSSLYNKKTQEDCSRELPFLEE
jgi:hypothetical protein